MGKYCLLDYAYANKTANGTQEDRAYNREALILNTNGVYWSRQTGTSSNENPGTYSETEINYASVSNPVISVKGFLVISDSDYLAQLSGLDDMCTTKGIKLFYMNELDAPSKPFTEAYGQTSLVANQATLIGTGIKCLLVRALSFNFTEPETNAQTKGLRPYTLQLQVTNPTR